MSSTRLIRLTTFLLMMTLGTCVNPMAPRYPEKEKEENEDPNSGDKQGMVILHQDIYWV
jgi:hypothetical protein